MKEYLFVLCVSLISVSFAANEQRNVSHGSVLFTHGIGLTCFTEYQKSLLTARIEIDKLIPRVNREYLNNDGLSMLLKYFHKISRNIERMSHVRNKSVAQSAFFDILGGYLKSVLVPMMKLSYYAGNITLHTSRELLDLYEKCKTSLDTKGLAWPNPDQTLIYSVPYAVPLYLNLVEGDCSNLLLLDDDEGEFEDQILALPRLEYDDNSNGLTNIWLPFRRKHVYNLRSKLSAFIFMRYFIDATKCYEMEKIPIENFNKRLERWIVINVVPHLKDEYLYAGLGGVLRVLRTLKDVLNDTTPLLPITRIESHRQRSSPVKLLKDHGDYDFQIMESPNVTEVSVSKEPLFTKDMMWITVFTVLGVLLIVLLFVFMKRCVMRKQRDMRNIPLADPPSHHDTSKSLVGKSRSGRNSKSYLARKQLPLSSSTSSIMVSRPKDYVNPHPTTVSYAVDEKKQKTKRNAFLTPLNKISTNPSKSCEKTPASFKVTSDSESEEEIFDARNFIETKDLTKEIPPHVTKNDTNLTKLTNKDQTLTKNDGKREKQTKKETKPHKFNIKGTVDVKMFHGVKDDNVIMKNSKKSKDHLKRTKSVENITNTPTIIHKRYNLESSAWETVHD